MDSSCSMDSKERDRKKIDLMSALPINQEAAEKENSGTATTKYSLFLCGGYILLEEQMTSK